MHRWEIRCERKLYFVGTGRQKQTYNKQGTRQKLGNLNKWNTVEQITYDHR
jgi:hypothetical protein